MGEDLVLGKRLLGRAGRAAASTNDLSIIFQVQLGIIAFMDFWGRLKISDGSKVKRKIQEVESFPSEFIEGR